MYTISLDVGTTNSRATIWKEGTPLLSAKKEIGVRNTAIDGHNEKLKQALKEILQEVLGRAEATLEDVEDIIGSGMISSNVGLINVPHLSAPVSEEGIRNNLIKMRFPDIIDKEITFVPGVRNNINELTLENLECMDMMRGEETEVVGILNLMDVKGSAIVILPGSHSKFISINESGEIMGCVTSLAGEVMSVITKNTIISDSLKGSFAEDIEKDYLVNGYESSLKLGVNRTFFSIRILDQFSTATTNQKANFLLGAVLASDIQAIKKSNVLKASPESKIVIAGKKILKNAFVTLVKHDGFFNHILEVEDTYLDDLSGFGSMNLLKRVKKK